MKKLVLCLSLTFLSMTFLPVQSIYASEKEKTTTSVPASKPAESQEAKVLTGRLNEINAMDKSKLSTSEKKNLRKEVKSIRTRLKDISGGIYISGAAVIVIIVLLIVLL